MIVASLAPGYLYRRITVGFDSGSVDDFRKGVEMIYRQLLETGSSIGTDVPLYPLSELHRLMGFEDVWEFERQWTD